MNQKQLETLTNINLDDLVESFGWKHYPLLAKLLRIMFRKPAETFAKHVIEYDDIVGSQGIVAGAGRRSCRSSLGTRESRRGSPVSAWRGTSTIAPAIRGSSGGASRDS